MEEIRDKLFALKVSLEKYDAMAEQLQTAKWFAKMVEVRLSDSPEKIEEAYKQVIGVESQRNDGFRVLQQLVPEEHATDVDTIRRFFLKFSTAYKYWASLLEELVEAEVALSLSPDEEEILSKYEEVLEELNLVATYMRDLAAPINTFKVV